MPILTNPFVDVVNGMNGIQTRPVGLSQPLQQRYNARQAAMYITMQTVMTKVTGMLAPGEKIINLMPMTNEQNSAAATDGIMGMYAAKTAPAKRYLHEQDSLRGNRLMVFTTTRILFFIVIEFLDDDSAYFSYPYSSLKAIQLSERHMSIPASRPAKQAKQAAPAGKQPPFWQREHLSWYVLDFQTTDNHVFTESLTAANGALFKHNSLTIPGMRDIEITAHPTRNTRFDAVMSNGAMQWRLMMGCLLVWFVPAGLYLLWLLLHQLLG